MPFDGLSDDEIRADAPSVFATQPHDKVSLKYAYLPSYHVVRTMRSLGFVPIRVREGTKKAPGGRAYAMHEIRFRQADSSQWSHQTKELGMLIPEAVFRNSHDRTSGAEMSAGLHRLACLNGMTVHDPDHSMRFAVRHIGRELTGNFLAAVQAISGQFKQVIDVAKRWQGIELNAEQIRRFAMEAVKLRGTTIVVPEANVMHARRLLDYGNDLWSVFNRAQENLTIGGLQGRSQRGAYRALPPIKSLAVDVEFNKRLWAEAAKLADEVQPAPLRG